MDVTSPKALVGQIQALIGSHSDEDLPKDKRLQACQLARKLWLELEEPGDSVDRLIFQPQENAMIEIAHDLSIYKYLVERKSQATTEELATATKCDPVLMRRILRNLAALNHIDEVDADIFVANKLTHALSSPKGISGQRNSWDWAMEVWQDIPAWLKSIGYQNPFDPNKTALHRAWNYDKSFFEFLPEKGFLDQFQAFMSLYRVDRAEFLDIFPAQERLIAGSKEDGTILVDVGGGRGHDVEKFTESFPQTKGRNVLQDQQDVLVDAIVSDNFKRMSHDFMTEQPIKGARAYYFRMIFHDWPDTASFNILKHTAAAMKPGYSKLLINDMVLPSKGATRYATQSDINMMSLFTASERSAADWERLLGLAGLKIVKIWPGVPESVIEAELAP